LDWNNIKNKQVAESDPVWTAASANYLTKADLGKTTDAGSSGALQVGVFDAFENSTATNVQGVLKDLDTAVSNIAKPAYDSGWFAENDTTYHTKTLIHNLGVIPSKVQVWFSEDNPPTGYILPVELSTWNQSGGFQCFRVSSVQLEYFVYAGEGFAFWNTAASTYTLYKTGFCRVLLWK
jgi:hypothetical protein